MRYAKQNSQMHESPSSQGLGYATSSERAVFRCRCEETSNPFFASISHTNKWRAIEAAGSPS